MRSKFGLASALAGAVIVFGVLPGNAAVPTQHDLTFPAGLASFDVRGTADTPSGVLVLSDGDTVLAGTSTGPNGEDDSPAVIGLHPTGRPDPDFGNGNGRSILDLGDPATLVDLALGPNDTIVGLATNTELGAAWIFRLTSDGQFDLTFNPGVGSIEFDDSTLAWNSIAVAHDGSIVMAGTLTPGTGPTEIAWIVIAADGDTTDAFLSSVTAGVGDASAIDAATDPRASVNRVDILGAGVDASESRFAHIVAVDPSTSDPDTTFSGDGRATVKDPSFSINPASIAVLASGKLVLGASVGSPARAEVLRLMAGGARDTTFSGDGIARVSIAGLARTVSVVPSSGGGFAGMGKLTNGGVGLFRVTGSGSLDSSFSGDGLLSVFPAARFVPAGVAVDTSNRVLVGGSVNDGPAEDLALLAVTASGSPDTSVVAASGTASQFALGNREGAFDVFLDATGAAFVAGSEAGSTTNDMVVEKLGPDGHRDVSFGGDGWGKAGFSNANATSIAFAGAKPILAGCARCQSSDWAIARLTAAGSPDSSFSGDGRTTLDWGGSADIAQGVATQTNGRIVAVGQGNRQFAIARLNAGGGLDPTFSDDGKLIANVSNGVSGEAEDVVVLPNGKILVAGSVSNGTRDLVLVVRLNGDGTFDQDFGGNGRAVFAPADDVVSVSGLAIGPKGRILVSGTVRVGSKNRALAIRLDANGTPDSGFSGNGFAILAFGQANVQAVDVAAVGNKVLLGLATDSGSFAVGRLTGAGAADVTFGGDGLASVLVEQTDVPEAIDVRGSDGRIYEVGVALHDSDFDFGVAVFTP